MFGNIKIVLYFCKVFFMVLDLWLGVKIGCRETTIPILFFMVMDSLSLLYVSSRD